MLLHKPQPIANGLRTDHPVPGLPFVDDSHIPVADPHAIEAVGRRRGTDMWGREDRVRDGGWAAFTTDPLRHDLGWAVRWHPQHGRSVLLYRDEDTAAAHVDWDGPALLARSGGYWWDGATWYRPAQVWDAAREEYYRQPVPAAITVSAADLLAGGGDPERGQILDISDVSPDSPVPARWLDDLALWAQQRGDLDLAASVVKLAAPEFTSDQLVGVAELARIGGVAASTLRAYIARGEGDVPEPQAIIGGRSVWARPVAEDWAERRRRSAEGVTAAVAASRSGIDLAPGIGDIWDRFTRAFTGALWNNPDRRRRWALRWRSKEAIGEVARDLGWYVAGDVGQIIPTGDLAATIRHAVIDEFAETQGPLSDESDPGFLGVSPPVARMLDWLIRHHPAAGGRAIGEIIRDASQRLDIPRAVTERSLRTALNLDSKLDPGKLNAYLDLVLSPEGYPSPDDSARAAVLTLVRPAEPGSRT